MNARRIQGILAAGVLVMGVGIAPRAAWAATASASATVRATVLVRAELVLERDSSSSTRGTKSQIVFDTPDDRDQTDGDPGLMYAPYRSEINKNWHFAEVVANGTSMQIGASVTGTAAGKNLADLMEVFTGGFFPATGPAGTPISGTPSTVWERLDGWQRSLTRSFIGVIPFNYRLKISEIGGGTYSGTVTFTLTSN